MLRTAMSLGEGYKDQGEAVHNASDRLRDTWSERQRRVLARDPVLGADSFCLSVLPCPTKSPCRSPARRGAWAGPLSPATYQTLSRHLPSPCVMSLHCETCFGFWDLFPTLSCPYCALCQARCHLADAPRRDPDDSPGHNYSPLVLPCHRTVWALVVAQSSSGSELTPAECQGSQDQPRAFHAGVMARRPPAPPGTEDTSTESCRHVPSRLLVGKGSARAA